MKQKDWYVKNRQTYEKLSKKVQTILIEIFDENQIEYHQVNCRTKTFESFSKKMSNPKYKSETEVTDLSGIRVISYVEDSIPFICRLIEENFEIDKENSLDKSKDLGLDKVGYKSVHYIAKLPHSRVSLSENKKFKDLKFEIQVRTILQHSWAEIEHDRNYKFVGNLPDKIQRRFKLLAGLLELADNEFNSISKEIDSYSKEVKSKAKKGDLEIAINSTSLQQYIKLKISSIPNVKLTPKSTIDEPLIKEVLNYGVDTLNEFESIIPDKLFETYAKISNEISAVGIVRDVLIIHDYKRYFNKSYQQNWIFHPDDFFLDDKLYSEFGLDIRKLNNLTIHIEDD
ncbi:MAG: hypothetical protein AAGA43_02520 [Bacteroidota bacterium]